MARIWDQNEEIDENEELVVTEHRDEPAPAVSSDEEQSVETATGGGRAPLDALGEDVSSSPARRGRATPGEE